MSSWITAMNFHKTYINHGNTKTNWKRNIFFTNPENSSTYLSLFLSFINGTHKYIKKTNILKVIDCLVVYFKTPQNYMCMMEKHYNAPSIAPAMMCARNKMHDFHNFLKKADFSIDVFHSLDKRKAGISYGMNVSYYAIPTEYNVTSITYGVLFIVWKFLFAEFNTTALYSCCKQLFTRQF